MFLNCVLLKQVKFINPKTEEVINMDSMFNKYSELKYLDFSNFNTIKVTNMECMFNRCYKLKEIKGLNKFNTSKVTNISLILYIVVI